MPEILTSVRIDEQVLENLKIIASANGTSVAAELRMAASERIERVTKSQDFQARLEARMAENQASIDRLLSLSNPS